MIRRYLLSVIVVLTTAFSVVSCSKDPEWADPEAHEKTIQLNEKYGPLMVGTWHYENSNDKHHFIELLTFKDDGTFTGKRIWQSRKLITIDGKEQYTDWEDVEELSGSFSGKWSLRYWSPEGDDGIKRNCLNLYATYDDEPAKDYMAYSHVTDFDYANETTLRIRGIFFNDEDGWANYQRDDASNSTHVVRSASE